MTIQICCSKDYILVLGQLIDELIVITSGSVELVNDRGMVCRTFNFGSFFGEKCAFYKDQVSAVSYRARTDVEMLVLPRPVLLALLNAYDEFCEEVSEDATNVGTRSPVASPTSVQGRS